MCSSSSLSATESEEPWANIDLNSTIVTTLGSAVKASEDKWGLIGGASDICMFLGGAAEVREGRTTGIEGGEVGSKPVTAQLE